MKTKIFLLFVVYILYAVNIHAELKHFLPHSNAIISILDKKYWFEGDTIIKNKRYTKVYRKYYHSETEYSEPEYYAAVREDTLGEKIYCIPVDDGVEILLADFDVKTGDEVMVYSLWFPSQSPAVVKNVDSILIDNQYRKRVNIVGESSSIDYPPDSWVEGLGSVVYGLFFPYPAMTADVGDTPKFLCLHVDDTLIYQNLEYNTCYIRDSGVSIPETKNLGFKVYPTLADNNLYVERPNVSCSYKIYNNQGMLVKSEHLRNEYLDVSILKQGIYYIEFYDGSNILHSDKFIKH
jgi:hypothetical protein